MKLRAFLNIGHTGRHTSTTYNSDRGASDPAVGDEVTLVWEYAHEARKLLDQAGASAVIQSYDAYKIQQDHACVVARAYPKDLCVWVGCHLNAGPGRYGLVLFDQRSTRGRDYGTAISSRLRLAIPKEVAPDIKTVGTVQGDPWLNAHSILGGVYSGPDNLCGIVYEPLFLSDKGHQKMLNLDGLRIIGRSLAEGILDAYAQELK